MRMDQKENKVRLLWLFFALFLSVGGVLCFLFFESPWRYFIGIHRIDGYDFLDLHCLLAAVEGHAAGLNVFGRNPLDVFGRGHNYPSSWLFLSILGWDRSDCVLMGMVLMILFALGLIFVLKPNRVSRLIWFCLFFFSPPFMLAVERANIDIIVWLLVGLYAYLLSLESRLSPHWASICLIVCVALKVYPLAAISACFGKKWKPSILMGFVGATLMGGGLYLWWDWETLQIIQQNAPSPLYWYVFSSQNIFIISGFEREEAATAAKLTVFTMVACFALLGFLSKRPVINHQRFSTVSFLTGASILVFCFFLRGNFDYRLIFLSFCLPVFFEIMEQRQRGEREWVPLFLCLTITAFWSNGLYIAYVHIQGLFFPGTSVMNIIGMMLVRDLIYYLLVGYLSWYSARLIRANLRDLTFFKLQSAD